MQRPPIHPAAAQQAAGFHAQPLREVQEAVARHDVVIVGMAGNPFVKRAHRVFSERNIGFHAIQVGSYLWGYRDRLAIKLWSGWPLIPQVFVNGQVVGGAEEAEALAASGELERLLKAGRASA